jgi:hypothetical protein
MTTMFTVQDRIEALHQRTDKFSQTLALKLNRESGRPTWAEPSVVEVRPDHSLLGLCKVRVSNVCVYEVRLEEGKHVQIFVPGNATPIPLHQVLRLVH